MDLRKIIQSGQSEAVAEREQTERRHAAVSKKAAEFGQNAATRLRELLTLKGGTSPDVTVAEPVVRETPRELRATVKVSGYATVGDARVTATTEVYHITTPAAYAPREGLDTLQEVRGTVGNGTGPAQQFRVPASCNYVTPHFHVDKAAFDRELTAAAHNLGKGARA